MLNWHRLHHPLMEPQDEVKLIFQATLGCGHLLGPEERVAARIQDEESTLSPAADEPLTEPLGNQYARLNLRRAMHEEISPALIARMMKCSLPELLPTHSEVVSVAESLGNAALSAAAQRLLSEPDWIPSHTAAYHAAYAPAYRVISKAFANALPAIIAIARAQKERMLVCIDGPCGSGKTTLAALLQRLFDAAVVPMDDFFLPHGLKTPERLALPGGNADWERVADEIVAPWQRGEPLSYRPYDCHEDALAQPVTVPHKQVTIIEGSYSLLPAIGRAADVRIYLQIDSAIQQERILKRNGPDMLAMFIRRWIPLEQAYADAYSLPDEGCITLQLS